MAHQIGQMFYYGEHPWHKLGKELIAPANLEEALKEGGLDWEVETVPITPAGEPVSRITHRVAVVRKDREPGAQGRVVGVVHPGFRPLQNRTAAELFDALLIKGERGYHTGGYLRDGEVIWLLAKLPAQIQVRGDDCLEPYLLFTNSHDGSVAIDVRLTTVRVVCQNTLSLALSNGAAGKVFRRAHNGSVPLLKEEAKGFFDFALKQCAETESLFARLADAPCGPDDFKRFLLELIPDPTRPITADKNKSVQRAYETRMENIRKTRLEVMAVHQYGIPSRDLGPVEPNWWGALNTVTGWVDHVQAIEGDRYAHILMGGGDQLKTMALTKAKEFSQ